MAYNLLKLEEKWGVKYPMVVKYWQSNWEHLINYFQYSGEIRKLIYTTNAIEGFHRQVKNIQKKALLPVKLSFLSSFIVQSRKFLRNRQHLYKIDP